MSLSSSEEKEKFMAVIKRQYNKDNDVLLFFFVVELSIRFVFHLFVIK